MNHSFDTDLAQQYGILEAVLLNHFQFWIAKNKANGVNFHDGRYWTYNSTRAFQELFPYATKRQIEKALKHLRDENVLLVGNYNASQYDRTLWYALSDLGESISPNGEMEIPEKGNGNDRQVTPIPDIDTDTNPSINTGICNRHLTDRDYDIFKGVYNEVCTRLPSVRVITAKRKEAIRKFYKDFTLTQWREICMAANASRFLTGVNDRGWKADIDFLMRPDKAAKILEGGYSDSGASPRPAAGGMAEQALQRVYQQSLAEEGGRF